MRAVSVDPTLGATPARWAKRWLITAPTTAGPCGSHFTSLRAFDAHRQGPSDDRRCELPDMGLVELTGVCKLADSDMPLAGVTVYELEATQDYWSYHRGRQAADMQRKSDVAA